MAGNLTPTEHVGQRIRLYRKKRGYTLQEFSLMIHRSVSAISKYENGMVSIDVDTMFDIADALEISVSQLTDMQTPKVDAEEPEKKVNNFFRTEQLFYMYLYTGFDKKLRSCAMEIIENPGHEEDQVMLYCGFKDFRDYTKCDYLYRGTITYNDEFVNVQASNPYNPVDVATIYASAELEGDEQTTTGIMLAFAEVVNRPFATKVLFSRKQMDINTVLLEQLMTNDKESISNLKRSNAMILY